MPSVAVWQKPSSLSPAKTKASKEPESGSITGACRIIKLMLSLLLGAFGGGGEVPASLDKSGPFAFT